MNQAFLLSFVRSFSPLSKHRIMTPPPQSSNNHALSTIHSTSTHFNTTRPAQKKSVAITTIQCHDRNPIIPPRSRVAVIGAGAAGLQSARQLKTSGYDVDVFEGSDHVGGIWAYSSKPVSTSAVYASLHTNIPKQVMAFELEEYPDEMPTYLSHDVVYDYLKSYAQRHDLNSLISFNTKVQSVKKLNGYWFVKTDRDDDDVNINNHGSYYDAVFICVGNYSIPRNWQVEGFENLISNGIEVTHSITYRTPDHYKDKDVLVVGAGPSGLDISIELSTVAKRVYLSHSKPDKIFTINAPANLIEIERVARVLPNGQLELTNKDDNVNSACPINVDCVIMCTGYRRGFPFLKHGEAGIEVTDDDRNVRGLVQHCVAMEDPTLSFIGLPFKIIPFATCEEQVAFSLAILEGRITREEFGEMVERERKKVVLDVKNYHVIGRKQWDYIIELARLAGRPMIRQSIIEMCRYATKLRSSNPQWYRNTGLKMTGEESGMWEVFREHNDDIKKIKK